MQVWVVASTGPGKPQDTQELPMHLPTIGTCAAAAALPTVVVWTVGPDEGGAGGIMVEERGVEGTGGCGGTGTATLCTTAIPTFPAAV
jgi:hypothetical protein